jgi:hypothetical protein
VPTGFYKDLIKEITALGQEYWKPAKSSHEKWRNPETSQIVIVARNLDSRHTDNVVLKSVGSTKKFQ